MTRTKPHATRTPVTLTAAVLLFFGMFAYGFGVTTTNDNTVDVSVQSVISVTPPSSGNIAAGSTSAGFSGSYDGSTLDLGGLGLGELVQAGLEYTVTTNNPTGYELQISSTGGSVTAMSSGTDNFPDLSSTPFALTAGSATGFGISAEGTYVDAQWGGTGSLYRNVPASPAATTIGASATQSAAAGDIHQVNFAASIDPSDVTGLEDGLYSAEMTLTGTTL